MKSICGRLRGREKAKQRNFWNWMKAKWRNTYFFHTGGYRIVNKHLQHLEMVSGEQDNDDNSVVSCSGTAVVP